MIGLSLWTYLSQDLFAVQRWSAAMRLSKHGPHQLGRRANVEETDNRCCRRKTIPAPRETGHCTNAAGCAHVSIFEPPLPEVAAQSRSPLRTDVLLERRWRFVACKPRHRSGTALPSFRHHRGRVRGTTGRTADNQRRRLCATQESKVRRRATRPSSAVSTTSKGDLTTL